MPSISTFSEITFSNWGPLTTTFTPAPSCATETKNVILGMTADPGLEFMQVSCQSPDFAGCIPTGTHTTSTPASTGVLNPEELFQASYFSPGLHCPAGWETVGIASRKGDASVTSGGVLSPSTPLPTVIRDALDVGPANALMQILDPSETAVLCCPSSMTGNTWLGCWSTLSDYDVSTACAWRDNNDFERVTRTAPLDGTTVVWEDIYTLTATEPTPLTSQVSSFSPSKISRLGLMGMSVVPIVTLVHQASDVEGTGKDTVLVGTVDPTSDATGTTVTGSGATSGATGATAGNTSNAAVRGASSSAWDGIGGVLGMTVSGIMLGAAMILA